MFHVCVFIFISIHNDICYIMFIINIVVVMYDDVYGIVIQDDWVEIELGDASY
jgi:hypothetical protein